MKDATRPLGRFSAMSVVVASMVGAGIFRITPGLAGSLGPGAILLAWILAGLLAIAGALCYAELGARRPEAGGEYVYISEAFGPALGFLSGFISLIAGFAAPVAAVALSFGEYLRPLTGVDARVVGTAAILIIALPHAWGVRQGAAFTNATTVLKLVILGVFIVGAGGFGGGATVSSILAPEGGQVFSAAFASAVISVSFAYTGWNAAAYVAGEIRDPDRSIPWALLGGAGLVMVLYVLTNAVFLLAIPLEDLAVSPDVGTIAAHVLFDETGARVMTAGISLVLISAISAFTMSGPRVTLAMARRGEAPRFLRQSNARGAPSAAVGLQTLVALVMVWAVRDVGSIFLYIGILLSLFSGLGTLAMPVLRRRDGRRAPFHCPGGWALPLFFAGFSVVMIVSSIGHRWEPMAASAGTIAAGLLLRWLIRRGGEQTPNSEA